MFYLVRHGDQILCPVSQQHTLFSEGNAEAVPDEQFFPQFIFQCFECL